LSKVYFFAIFAINQIFAKNEHWTQHKKDKRTKGIASKAGCQ
jgi:hypothetical protein